MTMRMMCFCTVTALLVAPMAFGLVLESGSSYEDSGGNGTSNASWTASAAGSQSNGSSSAGWGGGSGEQHLITTREGWCDCSFYVSAYAKAEVYLYSGRDSHALAAAYADAWIGGAEATLSPSAQVSGNGTGGQHLKEEKAPAPAYDQSTDYWGAYYGPEASHWSVAASDVPTGSDDLAFAIATAVASVSMSEQ